MINTDLFIKELKKKGFNFFSGVPCSYQKNLINSVSKNCKYVISNNEGDAVAICAGAFLGGKKSAILMQNSGLCNAISPLTSLNYIFKIPVLGFISLRQEESGELQHKQMGNITTDLLDLMEIKWRYLSPKNSQALKQISLANKYIGKNISFFFIVGKNYFSDVSFSCNSIKKERGLIRAKYMKESYPSRVDALKTISLFNEKHVVFLVNTGYASREMYELGDLDNKFYMVGSMGCISSIALGLAIAKKNKKILAIDGDGSLLMRMGSMTTNAYYRPKNMLHILLDNGSYESTGGQPTTSNNVDFVGMAHNCGYPRSIYTHNLKELGKYIKEWNKHPALTFLYLKIKKGGKKKLERPQISPEDIKNRLIKFLNK